MATMVRGINDLVKVFRGRMAKAVQMTRDEMFEVFQRHITAYYQEPVFSNGTSAIPMLYNRTYKMLNSLIKTDVIVSGDSVSCTVEVDPNYLNYTYIGGASGLDVMLSANDRFHGWSVGGDIQVWSDALEELGYEAGVKELLRKNLIKCGIPVK